MQFDWKRAKLHHYLVREHFDFGRQTARMLVPIDEIYQSGTREGHLPKYLIEREIPGAGKLNSEQLQGISQTSCGVLRSLGPQIQWLHSYVMGDKIYCVYIAPNEEMVREHARQGGFPANRVSEIKTIIDPTTAEKA